MSFTGILVIANAENLNPILWGGLESLP